MEALMFQLIFSEEETGKVKSIVTEVRSIRHINSREVAFTVFSGQRRSVAFPENWKLEVLHREVKWIESGNQ